MKIEKLVKELYESHREYLKEWWPLVSDTLDYRLEEILISCILVQQSPWPKVREVVKEMKEDGLLGLNEIYKKSVEEIAQYLKERKINFARRKAELLYKASKYVIENYGSLTNLIIGKNCEEIKEELLKIPGIGEMSCYYIMLYGLDCKEVLPDLIYLTPQTREFVEKHGITYEDLKEYVKRITPLEAKVIYGLVFEASKRSTTNKSK